MGAAAQKLKRAAYLLAEKTTRGTIEKKGSSDSRAPMTVGTTATATAAKSDCSSKERDRPGSIARKVGTEVMASE